MASQSVTSDNAEQLGGESPDVGAGSRGLPACLALLPPNPSSRGQNQTEATSVSWLFLSGTCSPSSALPASAGLKPSPALVSGCGRAEIPGSGPGLPRGLEIKAENVEIFAGD